ncbi:haloacid dehalogenase-like hydrolase [Metarhizium robertsii]|uniref:Haloacid dehalogenase n=2 Tax=Metarhizium robertsii TaxID=568076 RepID=E9ENL1_METRA|nr:haloacid dehalogenase [Metarhizium robertsii ARSEF 23]EFZ04223.1 haloacid dehalogenase [Metarhizium robertsii ARSEF 23]EXV01846.1 haloacid dehalogenase-like hydrolase [Metarhizium robertsii]
MAKLSDYRVLTFDCYGTIIDWETGVVNALQPLLDANNASRSRKELLAVYHECEAAQQAKTPDLTYDKLLAAVHPQVAARLGLKDPSAEESDTFGASVGQWPAFPDSVAALSRLSKYYKLVILSNVDRESFARTNAGPLQGFPFHLIITAQDVGSYKPDLANFDYMIREVKDRFGVEKDQIIQTAQSQFHDHQPAKRAGIKSSWIVRPGATMGNRADEIYDWKFDTLGDMADAVEEDAARNKSACIQ